MQDVQPPPKDPIAGLRAALDDIPFNKKADANQNLAVQKAAQECLNNINWNNLTDKQIDDLIAIQRKYNNIQTGKGFKTGRVFRTFVGKGRSQTEDLVYQVFSRASKVKTIEKEDGSKVTINVTADTKRVTLKVSDPPLARQVQNTLTEALPTITRSNMPNSLLLRAEAKLLHGSMSTYYDRKVSALKAKAEALNVRLQAYLPNEQEDTESSRSSVIRTAPDPRNLSQLMKEVGSIAQELNELRTRAGWETDRERNESNLNEILETVNFGSNICFEQLALAIETNPDNYVSVSCTNMRDRIYFHKRIKQLYKSHQPKITDEADKTGTVLQHKMRKTYDHFVKAMENIASCECSLSDLMQIKQSDEHKYGIGSIDPLAVYLGSIESAGNDYYTNKENFRESVQNVAASRLTEFGIRTVPERIKANFEAKIALLLQSNIEAYEADPEETSRRIQEIVHDLISDYVYEVLVDDAQHTQSQYLAMQGILNLVSPEWIQGRNGSDSRPNYQLTQKDLASTISAAKKIRAIRKVAFLSPYSAAASMSESFKQYIAKLENAVTELEQIKTALKNTKKNQEPLIKKIEELKLAITSIKNDINSQEKIKCIHDNAVSLEKTRRNNVIIQRFCVAIEQQMQSLESKRFQEQLQTKHIQPPPLLDVFTLRGRRSDFTSIEMRLWDEWIATKNLSIEMNYETFNPADILDFIPSPGMFMSSETKIATLKNEFRQFLQKRATFFAIMNQKFHENSEVSDEEMLQALSEGIPGYDEGNARKALDVFKEVKKQTYIRVEEAKAVLTDRLFSADGPRDLENWELLKSFEEYFRETGLLIEPMVLGNILEINTSTGDLIVKSLARDASPFYCLALKLKSIRITPSREQESANALGKKILRCAESYSEKTQVADVKKLVADIRKIKESLEKEKAKEEAIPSLIALEKECNALIINATLHISRLRENYTDEEWSGFSKEIAFDSLQTLANGCAYTLDKLYEICTTNSTLVKDKKNQYLNLLSRLARGEVIESNEITRITQEYDRALKICDTQFSLVSDKVDSTLLILGRPENAPVHLLEKGTLIERKKQAEKRSGMRISLLDIAEENSQRIYNKVSETRASVKELRALQSFETEALKITVKIMRSKEKIHKTLQIKKQKESAEFKQLSISKKIEIITEYIVLLQTEVPSALAELETLSQSITTYTESLKTRKAEIVEIFETATNQKELEAEYESIQAILQICELELSGLDQSAREAEIAAARLELSNLLPTEELESRMKQNICMGIQDRALELATESLTFPEEANSAEDHFVEMFFQERLLTNIPLTYQAIKEVYDTNESFPGPVYQDWIKSEIQELIEMHYKKPEDLDMASIQDMLTFLSNISKQRAINPETASMKDMLTFLSKASGKNPQTYNITLLNSCISFIVSKKSIPDADITDSKALALEIDSIFFGVQWKQWVHERCWHRNYGTLRRGAQEKKWQNDGIGCFSEIETFRTDKSGETLRKEFLKDVVIPAFKRHQRTITEDEANRLMNAMIALQNKSPANLVSCVELDKIPELKSLFFGEAWKSWVQDRCKTQIGIPRKGTKPDVWGPGGVQHLQELINAREKDKTDNGARIKQAFINRVVDILRNHGIADADANTAEHYINQAIEFQKFGALTSIKRKLRNYCASRDLVPSERIQDMTARYFQAIGIARFTEVAAILLLTGMKQLYRQRQFKSLTAEKQEAYKNLFTADGINRQAATSLGLNPEQIDALQACYLTNEEAKGLLQDAEDVRDWDVSAETLCEHRLQELDRALFPPAILP